MQDLVTQKNTKNSWGRRRGWGGGWGGGEAVLHNQEYTRDLKIVKFYYEKRSSRIQSNYYYIKLLFFTFFKKMILKRCSFLVTFAIKI